MKASSSKKSAAKKPAPKAKPAKAAKTKPAGKKSEGKVSKKKGKDGDEFEEFEVEGEIDFPIEESFEDDYDGFEEDDDL